MFFLLPLARGGGLNRVRFFKNAVAFWIRHGGDASGGHGLAGGRIMGLSRSVLIVRVS